MTTLTHLWETILGAISSVGYVPFAVMVIATIVLYRLHPVLGFLGVLFLFAILTGLIT